METLEVLGKMLELQKLVSRKTELALAIAERYALDRSGDRARDLSLHMRDSHSGHFNIEYDLKCQREYREEMQGLREQYHEVCEQVKLLEAMLEAEIPVPSGT